MKAAATLSTTELLAEIESRSKAKLPFGSLLREFMRRRAAHIEACRRGGQVTGKTKARTTEQARAAAMARHKKK